MGTLVADSGLTRYSFVVGLGHAHGPEAILSALTSSLCRQPLLRRCPWWWWLYGMEEVRLWKKMVATILPKKGQSIGCRRVEGNVGIDERQAARPE
jgi:hypothetical protein